jgi:hypothetical protein
LTISRHELAASQRPRPIGPWWTVKGSEPVPEPACWSSRAWVRSQSGGPVALPVHSRMLRNEPGVNPRHDT